MPSLFKPMAFQLKTERLELSMWEESDSVWLSKLIGERGVDIPAVDSVRNRLIEMRKKTEENGISLLTIRRRNEGDFIGYCGLIIGRSTLEEPRLHTSCSATLMVKVMRLRHLLYWTRLLLGAKDFGRL